MFEDSYFTMSTLLKNETPPFFKSILWLRSRKIPVESFLDLESEPSFHSPSWMKWSLGDMRLELNHYAKGMQTYLKHSFSFQACVNMKQNPSRVLHGSSLCKKETMPNLHLVIVILISSFLLDEPWFFYSIATISLADHMLSLGCFSFPEELQKCMVLLASLLTITCFE